MGICSHLLNKFLMKQLIFCALICASKQTENTVKKKITHVASLFTFFEKVFAIFNFFTAYCLGFRFWGLCCFICLKFNPFNQSSIRIFFPPERKCVDLEVIFNKGREETFESCVCIKYLALVRPQKLIPMNFASLYSV